MKFIKWPVTPLFLIAFSLSLTGCGTPFFHQPGSELDKVYSKVFLTDYNTAWQAVLESVKRFEKTVQNRQGGIIQTAWIDNTAEKNFIDSFGGDATYLKSRYRMNLIVAPGTYNGRPSVKVSVTKDQMIQRDMLEGWKQVQSDAIEENSILYRVGRVIWIKLRLKKLEEDKMKQVLEEGV